MAEQRPYTTTFQRAARPVKTFQHAVRSAAAPAQELAFPVAVGADDALHMDERWPVFERATAEIDRVRPRRRFTLPKRR